jgi:hypothetical protein
MSTTEGSTFEPATGAPRGAIQPPVGAIPQAPAPGGPGSDSDSSQSLRLLARSGDTDVVFRLNRRLPFLRHLAEVAAERLDRLADQRRLLIAGAVVLLALGALATVMGGAYRKPPASPPVIVAPVAPPAPGPVSPPVTAPPELASAPDTPAPVAASVPPPPAKAVAHRRAVHPRKPHARAGR